jgi:hypothetical protein
MQFGYRQCREIADGRSALELARGDPTAASHRARSKFPLANKLLPQERSRTRKCGCWVSLAYNQDRPLQLLGTLRLNAEISANSVPDARANTVVHTLVRGSALNRRFRYNPYDDADCAQRIVQWANARLADKPYISEADDRRHRPAPR